MGLPCSSSNSDSDPTATMAGWTVREALDESMRRLTDKNVTEPDYSALYLMAASLELPWERGIRDLEGRSDRHQSTRLTAEQAIDLEAKLKRREDHEPIQYVLGQWDFLDYTIAIRKPLLCPRPETEELVLKVVEETTESPVHILDVGCGTGVIGISLAELLPDATVEAIDVEPVAIETSMENAQRVLKDQAGGIDKYPDCYKATLVSASEYTPEFPFDVVVSNPPYIPRSDMEGLSEDVTQHESDIALCGGTDGMDVIYTIIERLPEWCNTDAVCWMEVDPSHPKLIEEFLSKSASEEETGSGRRKKNKKSMFSGRSVRFESSHKDMFGKDRFVKLRVV
jgi:release factor glutamine methyltransferase